MKTLSQRTRRRAPRRQLAGYTVVEVLMSMAVLAVGVVGIIATEKVTVAANQHAKNLAIATQIGKSWLGMLNAEAALWGRDGTLSSARNPFLSQVANNAWFRPTYVADLDFGPAFDALGNSIDDTDSASFCVDLRVAPLTTTAFGGGTRRVEVRVMWLRDQPVAAAGDPTLISACSLTPLQAAGEDAARFVQLVFMSSAVRQVGS